MSEPTGPLTPAILLRCYDCGREEAVPSATHCRSCGGSLVVAAERELNPERWRSGSRGDGLWRFASALVPVSAAGRVTLAEGGTPLLPVPSLTGEIPVAGLLLKDESRNPTGTFKDRCLAVAASVAFDSGAPGLVCASTGNAGASTAAYGARGMLPTVILIPDGTSASKLAQALICGATVVAVEGTYSDAHMLADAAAEALGYVNTTTTYVSPYAAEGSRTVAYELHEDLPEPPDWILVPVGAGPLLAGIHAAYVDLQDAGHVDRVPRLVAVQPEGCSPIVRAFHAGTGEIAPWGDPITCVGSLADPLTGYEREGKLTLDAIVASGGSAVAVPDEETLGWIRKLGAGTGLFAEPGAAITLAAAERAVATGVIPGDATVVCCLTGTGLKDPYAALLETTPPTVPADRDVFLRWLSANVDERRA